MSCWASVAKKTDKPTGRWGSHLERMQLRDYIPGLYSGNGPRKQLSCTFLEKQDIVGAELVQEAAQYRSVGSQKEELGPEAL